MKETPLIDRVEEMELLKNSAEVATRGEGCAVFLYGEAGIGKTRLTRELRAYAGSRGIQILYGRCPSLLSIDSIPPYVLWKEVIRDYLQICTPEQLYAILGLFDGEVNIREAETERGLARFLRVKRMSGQKYVKDEILLTES